MSPPSTEYCSDEQRDAVESEAQFKLINGCAGSRKTDTICKLAAKEYNREKNVIIITLVGSVTNEIKERLTTSLGLEFEQRGNHFLGGGPNKFIEIANYDAMLHKQLATYKDPFLLKYGACFEEKTQIMYDKYVCTGVHSSLILANNQVADVVMMDEFQDLHPVKVKILTGIIKNSNGTLSGVAAGDYLQTIFDVAEDGSPHGMDIWRTDLGAEYHTMTRCFRCPLAHVRFVNEVLKCNTASLGETCVPPMIATNDDEEHRPFLFSCPPTSKNHQSATIARQVVACLRHLRDIDPSIKPQDVAIIMARANRNAVFRQTEHILSKLYASWGYKDAVKMFETKRDGEMTPIKWEKAVGKTVLLSVHGDKGKGHKVVFFLGVSENAIPKKTRLFTNKELIDISLLNVGLTRSTRWLFVGFTHDWPSRYLVNAKHILAQHAILSWDPNTYKGTQFEEMCADVHKLMEATEPTFDSEGYVNKKITCPDKLFIEVRHDISTLFEHPKHIAPHYPWGNMVTTKFGKCCSAPPRVSEEQAHIYGTMAELMFNRHYCIQKGCMSQLHSELGCVLDNERIMYTNSQFLVNVCQDECINHEVKKGISLMMFKCMLNRMAFLHDKLLIRSPTTRAELTAMMNAGATMMVLPAALRHQGLRDDVSAFLQSNTPNKALPTRVFWNVAILWEVLYDKIRMPSVAMHLNKFDEPCDILHHNTECLYAHISKLPTALFNVRHCISASETDPTTLDDMGITQLEAKYGIVGISDFETEDAVFEIKCPLRANSGRALSWAMQPLMYYCLSGPSMRSFHVIDLTSGEWHKFEANTDRIHKKSVVKAVLTKLNFRPEHVKVLMKMVE